MHKAILIIDDDSHNVFALSAILKARGFQTASATNMTEAFDKLDNEIDPGIILMDMMMPGMDGYEAIPKLKASSRYQNIPVVAVTAQAMAGDREKCLSAGADEYISKPVDIDKLMFVLNKCMP